MGWIVIDGSIGLCLVGMVARGIFSFRQYKRRLCRTSRRYIILRAAIHWRRRIMKSFEMIGMTR